MKTATMTKETYVSDVTGTTDFSMQNSGKMFHILMAGLYSNKPESITREIWSNAYDAHKMAGKEDQPFEITFPNNFNPEFVCRDFGEGISHDDMKKLYTILGYSSKEDSNDAVGKWGVGRMSPMSYTDSFTVTSIHKGMKAIYNVMLDDDSKPKLHTFMEPTPTDEPSGLRVSFPVNRTDIDIFQRAALRVSLGFDIKPTVTNKGVNIQWPIIKKVFEGEGYYFYEPFYLDHNKFSTKVAGPLAKMGCVIYPIDRSIIPDNVLSSNVIIEFPIGALGVTASRESLSYARNEPTKNNIQQECNRIRAELTDKINKEIASAKSPFHAGQIAHKFSAGLPPVYGTQKWKGVDVTSNYFYCKVENKLFTLRPNFGKALGRIQDIDLKLYTSGSNYVFVLHDVADGNVVRSVSRMEPLTKDNNVFYVEYDGSNPLSVQDINYFIGCLDGGVTFVKLKDLPDPGVTRSSVSRGPVKVKVIDYRGKIHDTELSDADYTAGGVYVPLNGRDFADGYGEVKGLADYLTRKVGLRIYGVPKTLMKKFKDQPQWVDIKTWATNHINQNVEEFSYWASGTSTYVSGQEISLKLIGLGSPEIDTYAEAVRKLQNYKNASNSISINKLVQWCGVSLPPHQINLKDLRQKVVDKFPLLPYLQSTVDINHVKQYIKALA